MDVGDEFVVTVPARDLAALILAVHESASGERSAKNRWTYENVIGMGKSAVCDLDEVEAHGRYPHDGKQVAAVTVTQGHVAVDVVIDLDEEHARARFHPVMGPRSRPAESDSFASYLARRTAEILGDRMGFE